MKQSKALYCLTVGYITGASLNKTHNYDLVNNGYSLRVQFTPITFVKLADLNQPIHHAGQTYFFGHSPQELYKIAAMTKKDLEDGLAAELNWVNVTRKKLQSNWAKLADLVAEEMKEVERSGGAPEIPKPANTALPATPPAMVGDEEPLAAVPEPVMAGPVNNTEPVSGSVERRVHDFRIYAAASKTFHKGSKSVGYFARILDCSSGQVKEIGKSGYTDDFGKILIRALKEAFEADVIPPSSKAEQTKVTVYTANEFVANMFAKGYLRSYARKNWAKKDGTTMAHKELWEAIWNRTSHMLVTGVLCEPDRVDLKDCTQKARPLAEEDYKKRYDLIGPSQQQKQI